MPAIDYLQQLHDRMQEWRRHFHANPELALEEHNTSQYIADALASLGYSVTRGIGGTGLVATLQKGAGRSIGLRSDMDALSMKEENDLSYRSRNDGVMHACGHDGHMAMLMGAAHYLAERGAFTGTVHLIFQPAEENEGGADCMIRDGLFDRFPVDAVFGLHNMPGVPLGSFAVRTGPIMASFAAFDIVVKGSGGHGAMPHTGTDTVLAAANIVTHLHEIISRNIDALEPAVLSVTKIKGGTAYNIMPDMVALGGTVRTFNREVEDIIERRMREICEGTALATGVSVTLEYKGRYPATVNSSAETDLAVRAACDVAGADSVNSNVDPSMGSEDFSLMLQQRPGAYMLLGTGDRGEGTRLHQPRYDFNDDLLVIGASWWVRLVELFLSGSIDREGV